MSIAGKHAVIDRLSVPPISHVTISGVIDETFAPQQVLADAEGHVLLEIGRVTRISSYGVRRWIEVTATPPKSGLGPYLVHAPAIMVDQMALVEGFIGVGKLLSVLAPYVCESCEEDRLRLVDLRADQADIGGGKAPAHACPVCKKPLVFADRAEEFFDYPRTHIPEEIDPAIDKYLRSLSSPETIPELATPLKIVQNDLTYLRLGGTLKAHLNVRRLSAGLDGRVGYDFACVAGLEAGAEEKLTGMLEMAAQGARVFLWRAPPAVLRVLASAGKSLPSLSIASLWLPCECRTCGTAWPQALEPTQYLAGLRAGAPSDRTCPVCGGAAQPPRLPELENLLEAHPPADAPAKDFACLAARGLSQTLGGSTGGSSPDVKQLTPSKSHPKQGTPSGPHLTKPGSDVPVVLGSDSGRMQIIKQIGQGGMAEVFLARQVGLKGFEKYVVVKKILPHFAQDQSFVDMLFAEARANARLTHPNIVQTYDVGEMDGSAYITMEYVRGPDLKRLMVALSRANIKMPIEHALCIVSEIANGLHFAHCYVDPTGVPHPMVHRDVSPHNILVSLDGALKLSDFGIAKVEGESERTQPGVFKGKMGYVAPEAITGATLDARADVFSLGVVLYELCTNRVPFRKENDAATLRAIMHESPPPPHLLNPAVPPEVSTLVMSTIAKDREKRYQSAGELREDVEKAMSQYGYHSSPTAVASFFLSTLGDKLSAFSPVISPSITPTGGKESYTPSPMKRRSSVPSMPSTPSPSKQSPPETMTSVPATLAPPPLPPKPSVPPAPAGSGSFPEVAVEEVLELKEEVAPVEDRTWSAVTPWQVDPQKLASSEAATAHPKPESATAHPVDGDGFRPGSVRSREPQQAVDRYEVPPSVERPPTRPVQPTRPGRGKPGAPVAAVSLALLALVLGGVAFVALPRGRVDVTGLAPGDRLYVDGLRVDAKELHLESSGSVIVSVARDGRLHRVGTASADEGIDVHALVEASPGRTEMRAPLQVVSNPVGCAVRVAGVDAPSATPVTIEIEVGRELEVLIFCPGHRIDTRWVMAAPGQTVNVSHPP